MAVFGASIPQTVALNPLLDLAKVDQDVQGYQFGQQKLQSGAQDLQNTADIRALAPQIAAGDQSAILRAAAIDPKQGYYLAHAVQAINQGNAAALKSQPDTLVFGDSGGVSGVGPATPKTAVASGDGIIDALGKGESPGPGVVNAQGYSGQFQFGKARLAELGAYQPTAGENLNDNHKWSGSFNIPGAPEVKTYGDFLNNSTAQRSAMHVHVDDIQKAIAATPGAEGLNPNGLVAVAHLGGVAGMRKFIASGGQYNPADANGTHLSDYYTRYSKVGPAQLAADHGHPDGPLPPPPQQQTAAAPLPINGQPAPVQVASLDPSAGMQQVAGATVPNPLLPTAGDATQAARNPLMDSLFGGGLPGVTADPATPQQNPLMPQATAQQSTTLPPILGTHKSDGSLVTEGAPTGYVHAMVDDGHGGRRRGFAPNPDLAQKPVTEPKYTQHIGKDGSRTIFDKDFNVVRSYPAPDSGKPALPFTSNAMDAGLLNILVRGDPSSPEYAAAFANYGGEKVDASGQKVPGHDMTPFRTPSFESPQVTEARNRAQQGGSGALQDSPAPGGATVANPFGDAGMMPASAAFGGVEAQSTPNAPVSAAATSQGGRAYGTINPTGGAGKPLTEGQANAALYGDRMANADRIITETTAAGASQGQRALAAIPLAGNYLVSTDYAKAEQAQRDFVNAVLRRESGAAISPTEFESAKQQYFPQPGNPPELIAQKAEARRIAITGIQRAAGPNYKPPTPASVPTASGDDPFQTGTVTPESTKRPAEAQQPSRTTAAPPPRQAVLDAVARVRAEHPEMSNDDVIRTVKGQLSGGR